MKIKEPIRNYLTLKYLNIEDYVLGIITAKVADLVITGTSTSPSTDTFTEMKQELLIRLEHELEKRRFNNYRESLQVVNRIMCGDNPVEPVTEESWITHPQESPKEVQNEGL